MSYVLYQFMLEDLVLINRTIDLRGVSFGYLVACSFMTCCVYMLKKTYEAEIKFFSDVI